MLSFPHASVGSPPGARTLDFPAVKIQRAVTPIRRYLCSTVSPRLGNENKLLVAIPPKLVSQSTSLPRFSPLPGILTMPTESTYPRIEVPNLDLWGFLLERRDKPFPDDKGVQLYVTAMPPLS